MGFDRGSIVLLAENSSTLIKALKTYDKNNSFNVYQLSDLLISSILERLGPDGTLAIQTFDWGFCKKKKFDIRSSLSETSFLGRVALERSDFIRTQHPIYSFAVAGKYSEELSVLENKSAFGPNSPFAFFYERKGTMLVIDIPLHGSYTFAHFVEEMEGVDYRYKKSFTSAYLNLRGEECLRTYEMYVRDLERNVKPALYPLEDIFLKAEIMELFLVEDLTIRKIDMSASYPLISEDIKLNAGRSLHIKDDEIG